MDSYSITAELRANVDNFVSGIKQATSQMDNFVKNNKSTFDSFKKVGTVATAAGVAIATGLGATVKIAADYQQAFAGVRKTTDATEAEFAALSKGIRDMSKELPASAVEIANVAEVAGQLGIKKEDILKFTRTMVDMGVATNMSSEEAATALARFANITQMPMENIDRLGSTVVALGNNLATSEGEVVAMSLRLAGMGSQVGMTEAQIAALAGTMSSVGIEAEAGGTAMSMVLKKMQTAVMDGDKKLDGFAKAAGVSSKEFATAWNTDPIQALDMFIKGLGKSSEAGENLSEILGYLGIKGIREQDTLLRLSGASDILGTSVDIATTAWDENTALTKEAEERYKTLISKLQIFKNVVVDIARSIGDVLIPYVTKVVDVFTEFGNKIGEINPKILTVVTVVAALVSGFLLLVGPLLLLVGFVPTIISGFAALGTVFATLGTGLAAIIGPIGIAIAAIALIGTALVLAYNKVSWFRDSVNSIWEAVKSVTVAAFEVVKTAVLKAMDAVVNFAKEKLATLLAFWKENGAEISKAAQNVWNAVLSVVKFVMPAIEAIIKTVWFAVQVVVKSVWENIKGVIDGALNIIMGLVKTFSGLFTGNWKGMWDGIKQLFSGAVEFLWNAVQLMLWGKMLKGIAVFAGSFKTAVTTMWAAVKGSFTTAINAIKTFFTAGFNAMKSSGTSIMNGIKSMISTVWNGIKSTISNVINSVKSVVSSGFSGVANAIKTKMAEAVRTVATKMTEMLGKVTGAASKFLSAGKDLVRGLIKGIVSMSADAIAAVAGVVNSVVDKAKSLLGIASPRQKSSKRTKKRAKRLLSLLSSTETPSLNISLKGVCLT